MSEPSPEPPDKGPSEPRWQACLRAAADPLYLLDRRRTAAFANRAWTVLFVNRAWEALTGFAAARVCGARCLRTRDAVPASLESLLAVLAPPADALRGKPARVRRPVPRAAGPPDWWDITFLPFTGPRGRRALLARIEPVPRQAVAAGQPLPAALVTLRERAAGWCALDRLPSETPAQRRLLEQVRLASQAEAPLLLLGEPGAGKQWLARTIHGHGKARERTFALVDCARLPPDALAAVLFGAPGLCWRAHVGTVYLREPARLPRELQARLCDFLRAPAARRPRVLAGCATDPAAEVRAGSLLEELHCALSPLTIALPPLRERPADLPWLARSVLERLSADRARAITDLSPEAWDALRRHGWPGNVRELHNVLAGACARAKGERVEIGDLPWHLRETAAPPQRLLPLKSLLEQAERRLIELALRLTGGNKSRAADLLAVWRPQFLQKIKKLGIVAGGKDRG
jgi:transcriptional regulator of acetoin/glycerol metabolism